MTRTNTNTNNANERDGKLVNKYETNRLVILNTNNNDFVWVDGDDINCVINIDIDDNDDDDGDNDDDANWDVDEDDDDDVNDDDDDDDEFLNIIKDAFVKLNDINTPVDINSSKYWNGTKNAIMVHAIPLNIIPSFKFPLLSILENWDGSCPSWAIAKKRRGCAKNDTNTTNGRVIISPIATVCLAQSSPRLLKPSLKPLSLLIVE